MRRNAGAYRIASELARTTRPGRARTLQRCPFSIVTAPILSFHVQGRTDGNHYLEARVAYSNSSMLGAAKTFPHCCRVYRCSINVNVERVRR